MKKWLIVAACAVLPGVFADEPSMSEIVRQLEALQKQVQAQQVVIDQLKNQLQKRESAAKEDVSRIVKQELDAAIEKQALAKTGEGPLITLGKGIDGLEIKGDMRLRYEYRTLDGDSDNTSGKYDDDTRQKQRFRHRIRLGGVWNNPAEDFEIGLGMEFGSSAGNSANDSWNKDSTWESGDAYLDYAYAKHKWDNGLTLTLGQQKNPFLTTYALFDGDLRPTGVTAQWRNDMLFATVGAYNIRSDTAVGGSTDQSTANMYAGQIGLDLKGEKVSGKLAVAAYVGDSEMSEYVTGGGGMEGQDSYDYRLGDIYGEVSTDIGEVGVKAFGQYVVNFGTDSGSDPFAPITQLSYVPGSFFGDSYDPEDNDTAWVLGVGLSFRKFKAGYSFAHIEGDSIPWMFADSDFADGLPDGALNSEGHKISLGYKISKNCEIGATAFFTEPIEDDDETDDLGVSLYQVDLKYKF
jgi:hypothetical protein